MLRLLRRIRHSLIGSGHTRKYILYGAGEIALVVIGILIALQINNWNEWRKDRVKEKNVLLELKTTVQENIDHINWAIDNCRWINQASNSIISTIESNSPYSDTLISHFEISTRSCTNFTLSRAGYVELMNTGFDILKTDSLKRKIISLFETKALRTEQILSSVSQSFEDHKYMTSIFVSDANGWVPIAFDKLKKDQYYFSLTKKSLHQRTFITKVLQDYQLELQNVNELIKEELGERAAE